MIARKSKSVEPAAIAGAFLQKNVMSNALRWHTHVQERVVSKLPLWVAMS